MSTRLSLFRALETLCRGRPLALHDEIEQLRRWMTDSRGKRPSGYMNMPKAFSAYTAFHLPLHLPKLYWVLESRGRALFPKAPRRILDLGCGPGTLTLSYLLFASDAGWLPPESIDLVDFSNRALEGASRLTQSISGPKTEIKTHRIHLKNRFGLKDKFQADLILLGHVLNEWGNGPRHRAEKIEFIERIVHENLAPGGRLILVEPPLREPTTDLMAIRDRIAHWGLGALEKAPVVEPPTEEEEYEDEDDEDAAEWEPTETALSSPFSDLEILAPCPSKVRFCPMLRNHLGWCYAQPPREWAAERGLAPWDSELRRVTKTRLLDPGFAYLVLGRKNEAGAKSRRPVETKSPAIAITDAEAPRPFLCTTQGAKQVRSVPFRGAFVDRPSDSETAAASASGAGVSTSGKQKGLPANSKPVTAEVPRPKRFRMKNRR